MFKVNFDNLYTLFVFGVGFFSLWLEYRSSQVYKKETCRTTVKAINQLKNTPQSSGKSAVIKVPDVELRSWLSRHVSGEIVNQAFHARIAKDQYVFFKWPSVLTSPPPRSAAYAAPMLLTALGIFGTFLGIFVGLQGIGLEAIDNPSVLIESSTKLLTGMQTAFSTSVFGIAWAVVFMIVLPFSEYLNYRFRNQLQKKLETIAYLENPTNLLSRLEAKSDRDLAGEQNLSDLLRELVGQMQGLSRLSPQAIGSEVGAAINPSLQQIQQGLQAIATQTNGLGDLSAEAIGTQVRSALTPGFQTMQRELVAQRQAIEAQRQELLQTLVQQLRTEVIDPVAEQLAQSAATTREASQAVLEFRDAMGEVSQSLTGAVDTIQTFQQDTLQELQNFASSLQGTLQQFQQETQGVMTQIAADVRATIDQTLTEQTRILRETGQQAADLMDGARTNLTSTLIHIDEMLQSTRRTVQDELEVFRREYQNALTDFFGQQNNLLSGLLDEQRQGLAEVARQLQQVFREDTQVMRENITTSMQQIRNTSEVVHNLANTLGLTAGERLAQLQELARTLGGEVQRVERSYLNMEQQVNHLLSEGNKQLMSYLNQANEIYSGSIREADHAASNALTQLNNTSHGLMSVAEYLVAAAQELRDGRR